MNKKIILIAILIIIGVIAYMALNKPNTKTPENQNQEEQKPASKLTPRNANYLVETDLISLQDGKAETVNQNGAAKTTTEITGEPANGDLNSDGQNDWAIVLKQQIENDPGVYYYAAVALVDEAKNMIAGSNAVALGEGIKIEDIAIVNQAVRINYLERKLDGDNVEKVPTLPVSKTYILDGVMFKELTPRRANAQAEAACTDNRGGWNKDKNECSGISKELCAQFGGNFENNLCRF